ncbi:MAG: radical SAM family heme chaperone HemW [Bacteroidales bacterium]
MAGIYIHIPFCRHKCSYCNFFSIVSQKYRTQIVPSILQEIDARKDTINQKVETVYFGGGTPSLLTISEIERIIKKILSSFKLVDQPEITFEANPDDIETAYLNSLIKLGVNRISIGIQSFRQEDLNYLERTHNARRISKVMNAIVNAGVKHINADLIYGVPGQTEEAIEYNINQLLDYPLDHVSAYALTVEPQTKLKHQIQKREKSDINESAITQHFYHLSERLTFHGFEHYEISNFALPDCYSKHNTNYWYQKPYLGLGPSAHSYDGTSRWWNIDAVSAYVKGANEGNIPIEMEILTIEQKFNEFIMLRLRTKQGIDMQEVARLFGPTWHNELRKAFKSVNNPEYIRWKDNKIVLTRKGFWFADGLAAQLFRG